MSAGSLPKSDVGYDSTNFVSETNRDPDMHASAREPSGVIHLHSAARASAHFPSTSNLPPVNDPAFHNGLGYS